MSLWLSAAAVGGILVVVSLAGFAPAAALGPAAAQRSSGAGGLAQRCGWSFLLGCGLLAGHTAICLALGLAPGWIPFLALAVGTTLVASAVRARAADEAKIGPAPGPAADGWSVWLAAAACAGVALYALRALTEPMWSNDFLAIWGLKGKAIFLARSLPARGPLSLYGFSHLEYPLGLPLLYAGAASLLGRWDDHALALFFPAFQAATLAVLYGWLRRAGASATRSFAAVTLLAWFEPLYSGFLTGLAEVPLSASFLLLGTAYSDSLDAGRGDRAWTRLAAASLLAGSLKNEGVFLGLAAGAGALAARRYRVAAAASIPALAAALATRLASGGARLRDFDFAFLGSRIGELPARVAETVRAEVFEISPWTWALLGCLAALLAAGRRAPACDRLLLLAAACLAAYLVLPVFAVPGPTWLVRTTLARTASALAPLIAAGLTGRLPYRKP